MRSVERLREIGFADEIVIVGAEPEMPYHRLAPSKQSLTGQMKATELENDPLDEFDAVWRLGTSVSQLDPGRRVVHLPGGEELRCQVA